MASILAEMARYLNAAPSLDGTLAGFIYSTRRPREVGDLAATLRRAGQEHFYHLMGETDLTGALVMLQIYGTKSINPEALEAEGEKLRLLLSGYIGTWGSIEIESVRYLPTNSIATQPRDASDYWQFRITYLMQVNHKQTPIQSGV